MIEYIARMVLARYDADGVDIPHSDLDDDQPITISFRCKIGDIRKLRRSIAMIDRGAELVATDMAARREYENSL